MSAGPSFAKNCNPRIVPRSGARRHSLFRARTGDRPARASFVLGVVQYGHHGLRAGSCDVILQRASRSGSRCRERRDQRIRFCDAAHVHKRNFRAAIAVESLDELVRDDGITRVRRVNSVKREQAAQERVREGLAVHFVAARVDLVD